jgi:predicted phosphodiesterase
MHRIAYISDVHLDMWVKDIPSLIEDFAERLIGELKDIDYIIVAGDIGHIATDNVLFLRALQKYAKHAVLCTTGNHDYYLTSREDLLYYKNSDHKVEDFEEACEFHDIKCLNPGIYVDYETNLRFLGFNGWYDGSYKGIDEKRAQALWNGEITRYRMNDSVLIYPNEKFNDRYKKDKDAVNHILGIHGDNFIDVVFSHVNPSNKPEHQAQEYVDDEFTTFYNFDGSALLEKINPKIWVYGHTHSGQNYQIGSTRVLCNPLGYPHEKRKITFALVEI